MISKRLIASDPNHRKIGAQRHADGKLRCAWCPPDPLYLAYHDTEWGVPVHADGKLFVDALDGTVTLRIYAGSSTEGAFLQKASTVILGV